MRDEDYKGRSAWRRLILILILVAHFERIAMAFEIATEAFQPEGNIPTRHTCDGEDLSPVFRWQEAPPATKSFALICDDPDAPMGTWVHWVMYDIPASVYQLEEGISDSETLSNGAKQGITDFGRPGYGGPCPPPGKPHRYYFKLYALDTQLNLPPRQTKTSLLQAMEGHVLAKAEIMGRYQRKR